MKQETIEQLMKIAGKQEYSQTLILSVSQVQTMLESAYDAGQRDLSFMAKPLAYPTIDDICNARQL